MRKDALFSGDLDRTWETAQQEIDTLMLAASSFAAHAALNPGINFEQHLSALITVGESYLFPAGYVN